MTTIPQLPTVHSIRTADLLADAITQQTETIPLNWLDRLLEAQPAAFVSPRRRKGWAAALVPWQTHPIVPLDVTA